MIKQKGWRAWRIGDSVVMDNRPAIDAWDPTIGTSPPRLQSAIVPVELVRAVLEEEDDA